MPELPARGADILKSTSRLFLDSRGIHGDGADKGIHPGPPGRVQETAVLVEVTGPVPGEAGGGRGPA